MSDNVHAFEVSFVDDMLCLGFVAIFQQVTQLFDLIINLGQVVLQTVDSDVHFPFELLGNLVAQACKFVGVESCHEFLGGTR